MTSHAKSAFLIYFTIASDEIHDIAKEHGFWIDSNNFGEKIALIHSELSEALEAKRNGDKLSPTIAPFSAVSEELADAIIRIVDLAQYYELPLGQAILKKMEYNKNRPYKHNKEF